MRTLEEIPILFIGQCKSGSNALFEKLAALEGFEAGEVRRASYRAKRGLGDYFSNWASTPIRDTTRYLLDKTIIAPKIYDYRLGVDPRRNRMIYQVRNPYETIRSQFLFTVRGEPCWRPGHEMAPVKSELDGYTFEDVCHALEYNLEKITHLENVKALIEEQVFERSHILFTTLEEMRAGTGLRRVEAFLDVTFGDATFPHSQKSEDRYESHEEYARWAALFDRFAPDVYRKYVRRADYEKLSDYAGIDLVRLYGIS